METPRHFIYTHQAKLAWKYAKHGIGVALGHEAREGRTQKTYPKTKDSEFLGLISG